MMLKRRHSFGFGVIGWLVGSIAILVLLAVSLHEGQKAYWDSKVREMCAKDGGARVLNAIDVDQEEYSRLLNKFGKLEIPFESSAARNAIVFQRRTSTYIRKDNPAVRRDRTVIVRGTDGQTLAEIVIYSRVGGDVYALHPSYFTCPESLGDVYSSIIRLRGEKK
jgi:hypothetical protein